MAHRHGSSAIPVSRLCLLRARQQPPHRCCLCLPARYGCLFCYITAVANFSAAQRHACAGRLGGRCMLYLPATSLSPSPRLRARPLLCRLSVPCIFSLVGNSLCSLRIAFTRLSSVVAVGRRRTAAFPTGGGSRAFGRSLPGSRRNLSCRVEWRCDYSLAALRFCLVLAGGGRAGGDALRPSLACAATVLLRIQYRYLPHCQRRAAIPAFWLLFFIIIFFSPHTLSVTTLFVCMAACCCLPVLVLVDLLGWCLVCTDAGCWLTRLRRTFPACNLTCWAEFLSFGNICLEQTIILLCWAYGR